MTDSLARIRAEQAADAALENAHPDPLSIAGELQARAADRCARKRALWAADQYHAITCEDPCGGWCDCWCHECGPAPSGRANQAVVWDNSGTSRSVPAPAATGRGLGRTGLESDAMSVPTTPPARKGNAENCTGR